MVAIIVGALVLGFAVWVRHCLRPGNEVDLWMLIAWIFLSVVWWAVAL